MSNKQTSRVLDTWDALYDLVDNLPWTAHPSTQSAPAGPTDAFGVTHSAWYGDLDEPKDEAIVVVGVAANDPALEVSTFGSSSSTEEEFTLRIIIGTRVQGLSVREVRARLGELCNILQEGLRSPLSGRPAGGFNTTVPGVLWWRMTRFAPQVGPIENGYAGYAELDFLFHAHI